MPASYMTMMGTATSVWFTGSNVGVIIAAATKASTTAIRRKIFAYFVLSLFGLIAFVPFYYMFLLSLDAKAGFGALDWPPQIIPSWKWENYSTALVTMPFGRFFINTFIVTFLTVSGAVISSAAAGYVFARVRLKGKNVLFILMLATLIVPPQVSASTVYATTEAGAVR